MVGGEEVVRGMWWWPSVAIVGSLDKINISNKKKNREKKHTWGLRNK